VCNPTDLRLRVKHGLRGTAVTLGGCGLCITAVTSIGDDGTIGDIGDEAKSDANVLILDVDISVSFKDEKRRLENNGSVLGRAVETTLCVNDTFMDDLDVSALKGLVIDGIAEDATAIIFDTGHMMT
jgi:hypothetical protein